MFVSIKLFTVGVIHFSDSLASVIADGQVNKCEDSKDEKCKNPSIILEEDEDMDDGPLTPEEYVWDLPHRNPHSLDSTLKDYAGDSASNNIENEPDFPDVSHWSTPDFEIKLINKKPRIFLINNFITPSESELLIRHGMGKTKPALVVESKHDVYAESEENPYSSHRNNEQYPVPREEEKKLNILNHLNKRAERTARIPYVVSESLQIGRYGPGEKYEMHNDSSPQDNIPRHATLFTLLQPAQEGGGTLFFLEDDADWSGCHLNEDNKEGVGRCCDEPPPNTYLFEGEVGQAVLFFNHDEYGRHMNMWHAACPVKKGIKWVTQKWFRYEKYGLVHYPKDPSVDFVPDRKRNERKFDVRVVNEGYPRIYYHEGYWKEYLESIKANPRLHHEKIESLANELTRLFDGYTEFYHIEEGRELRKTDSIAEVITLISGNATVIFPKTDDEQINCRLNGGGCCLGPNEGLHVPIDEEGDSLIFYPYQHNGSTREKWGYTFALCGTMQIYRHTYYRPTNLGSKIHGH